LELVHRTVKAVRTGTHRAESLEQTFDTVSRLAPVMGISRVANVTGLDSLGIPVVMVCRPNSRSLAVSQGKGVDLLSARVSGLMESAELYHAETAVIPLRLATYEELRYQFRTIDVQKLPRRLNSRFHPNLRLPWCEGRDLLTDQTFFVPYEMVHMNFTTPSLDGHASFPATSNGLASGNTPIEAISHAICEVVERDAITLWKLRRRHELGMDQLDLTSVDDPTCQILLKRFQDAGISVSAWDITSDIELATFACFLVPESGHSMWHPAVAVGHGCHPAREIALARALLEAAQTRLTVISGMRDDFRRDTYDQLLAVDIVAQIRRRDGACAARRHFADVPHRHAETLEEDVEWELECLRKAGIRHVIAVDLSRPEFGLDVVRVIIPGLEALFEDGYTPGRRAQTILKAQA
jgi:ribosomal protein S12 methylthiotransferase accessory factor